MSHYEWAKAKAAEFILTTREHAEDDLGLMGKFVEEPYALFLGSESGNGVVIEGTATELIEFVEQVYWQLTARAKVEAHVVKSRPGDGEE